MCPPHMRAYRFAHVQMSIAHVQMSIAHVQMSIAQVHVTHNFTCALGDSTL